MNEEQKKSSLQAVINSQIGNAIPKTEDHPLHILDNQVDPERKTRIYDVPQKPIRTYEKDMEEALAKMNGGGQIPVNEISPEEKKKQEEEAKRIKEQFIQDKIKEEKDKESIRIAKERNANLIPRAEEEHPMVPPVETPLPVPKPKVNIRTYESDVAQAMNSPKSTVVNMVLAENERKTGKASIANKPESHLLRNSFFTLISLILIGSGIGVGYYVYKTGIFTKQPVAQVATKIPSIVSPDTQKIINIPSLEKDQLKKTLISQFSSQEINPGKIIELIPAQTIGSTTKRVSGSQFLNIAEFAMTDTLKRSLTDKWMVGVYSSINEQGRNIPFIIMTTDFFQNAYSGMLKWEPTMPEELADLFMYREKGNQINMSNTEESSSTTEPVDNKSIHLFYNIKGVFRDRVKSNRDVREFISQKDELLMLYTFLDKDTLLITTSEEVIPALLERIEKQTYVR